jgi:molybdenum cofactor cytidylyltransferase
MHQHGICGLLLAAGQSRRFGSDKRLALLNGEPLMLIAARRLQVVLPDTLIVLGAQDEEHAALLDKAGIAYTHCPTAALGMGHSLAHGVKKRPAAAGWLIALADMPHLKNDTLRHLAAHIRYDNIVAPSYDGQRGHPVGFGASYYSELISLSGDSGAKTQLITHAEHLQLLPLDDAGVLFDIDSPSELNQHSSFHSKAEYPKK